MTTNEWVMWLIAGIAWMSAGFAIMQFYNAKRRKMEQLYHDYLSTACFHGLHERCRKKCKFCDEPCKCECHQKPETAITSEKP